MPRKGFRPEEIIATLREADVLLGQGKKVAEVVKALGVSEVTYRDELLDREVFHSLREAQGLIEAWRRHYNTVRPHSALGYRPPAPEAVPRPWPAWIPPRPAAGQGARVVYH
jgi:transposase InsO family protein